MLKKARRLEIFCDGGARGNPGPGAAACVINDLAGKKRFLCGKYLGRATNNEAEYAAVKLALELAKKYYESNADITFYLDSNLVVNQLSGLFKVKNPTLREIVLEIRILESSFGEVIYKYVPREENSEADGLVNEAIDGGKDFIRERPA